MRPLLEVEKRKSFMKRATILTVLALAACDDPSFPPQACGTFQDTKVFIGEQENVDLCFLDPDGDEVSVAATASDPSVVGVGVQPGGRAILLTGKDAGQAVITVVARDSKGLSSEPHTFAVTVPNRAPEAEVLPEITLTVEAPEASLTLTDYFSDPDGHPLTFAAGVSDETVIRAGVTNNTLHVEPVGSGSAVARVTATDPHGLSASGNVKVRLRLPVEFLTDEFEALSARWEVFGGAVANIVDGRLELAPTVGQVAGVMQELDTLPRIGPLDWTITTSTEYVADYLYPGVVVALSANREIATIVVLFGANVNRVCRPGLPDTNLLVYVGRAQGNWHCEPEWLGKGWFDEIAGKATPMNVGVSMGAESLKVLVADSVIHEIPTESLTPNPGKPIAAPSAFGVITWAEDFDRSAGQPVAYFDWIRVTGLPILASPTEANLRPAVSLPRPSSVRIIR